MHFLCHPLGNLGVTYGFNYCRLFIRDSWTLLLKLLWLRRYKQILVEVGAFQRGGSVWTKILSRRELAPNHCWYHKIRVFLLPHGKDLVILSSFIWRGYQRVTDRRRDRRTELPWLIQRFALYAMRPRCINGDRYNNWVNGSRKENHPCAIDWHNDLWLWLILNRPRSRS